MIIIKSHRDPGCDDTKNRSSNDVQWVVEVVMDTGGADEDGVAESQRLQH